MKINTSVVINTAIGMALGTALVVFFVNPLIAKVQAATNS